jgi:hypothetical protein
VYKATVAEMEAALDEVEVRTGEWWLGDYYTVAPVVMIVPGVLAGSQGALLYPAEELARTVAAWDHQPVTLGHPTHHGRPVSGSHPAAQRVGWVRFPRIATRGALVAEVWLDEQLTPPPLLARVRRGQPVEVSTGLYTDNHPVQPDTLHADGRVYVGIARRHRPDHLAILDGQQGACSVQDGCAINPRPNRAALLVDNGPPGLPAPSVNWRAVWAEMCPTRY